jgi:hypothetical protein
MAMTPPLPTWKACLEALPPDVIRRWACRLGRDAEGIGGIIAEWSGRLGRGNLPWSSPEKQAMHLLVWQVGEEGLPESDVGRLASRSGGSPARLRVGLSLLMARGLAFRLRLPGGERLYWSPGEVREAYLTGSVQPSNLLCKEAAGENRLCGVWDHLFHFLVMIDRDGLPLTKDRLLPRNIQRKWAAELELDSTGLIGTDWDQGEGEAAFRLLLELADRLALIRFETGIAKVNRSRLSQWLSQSWADCLNELFRLVEQAFLFRHPRHHPLWWWLRQQRGEHWCEWEETLSASWHDLAVKGGYSCKRDDLEDRLSGWMTALTWMRWMEQMQEGGRIWWRWAPGVSLLQQGIKGWKSRVQPDGEVLLPPDTPLDRRWRLAQFADYMGGDPLLHYLLLPESIQRGVQTGMTSEEMISVLQELTGRAVSPVVAASIQEWAQVRGARLESAWLAELKGTEWADAWTETLRKHPHWGRVLHSGWFALQAEGVQAFRQWLDDRGIPLVMETQANQGWRQLERQKDSDGEAVEEWDSFWQVEPPDTRLESAVPGWSSLPRMWTDSLRSYHDSTLRDLFREACRLELDVAWAGPDGQVRRLYPLSITAEGGEWVVHGREEPDGKRLLPLSHVSKVAILPPWKEAKELDGYGMIE